MTREIRREDYRPPAVGVEHVDLRFDIRERTTVTAEMRLRRLGPGPLLLDGRGFELLGLELDGRVLGPGDYGRDETQLRLDWAGETGLLKVTTRLDPERNDSMEGLYRSGPMLCTQCEAHGFSRITYYPDRPDVLARFSVRLEAERTRFPVLLANGNCIEQGDAGGGRHFARWEDPFPKPCYLFALVAGDLACVEDRFVTASGRAVQLRFYVDRGNEDRVGHAIESLKHAMRWDEQAYGLEYDLDVYMVVAARDFNMGAMENKGLNLFNAAYVLASPETATDADFENVESVIGHEYFHNWTGNRVTCRDWFQLSLKEGLTVFREQQFSAAMGSAAARRLREVRMLRARQFPEDAGPLAHPVRPEGYVEVNNFYTATVYEKGAELIRMIQAVVGADAFAEGVRAYLRRHDGQAATIEDFLAAHEQASGRSLEGFRRWYAQAGTPRLEVRDDYDSARGEYVLSLRQRTPSAPGLPVPIPIRFALRDAHGRSVEAQTDSPLLQAPDLIVLDQAEAEVRFRVTGQPVPSLLRGFSAPVLLDYPWTDAQLALLLRHDDDAFVRWEAGQQLMQRAVRERLNGAAQGPARTALLASSAHLAAQGLDDHALLAELLRLPSPAELLELLAPCEPLQVADAHEALRLDLARALTGPLSVWAQW
ncbi:MAG TPA: aminopeptidase N, partial [Candidatus Binatia bacterium]|nr:aminopeptidase N [Candidatus Binatia bacterium]